jgi:hypothetical protein
MEERRAAELIADFDDADLIDLRTLVVSELTSEWWRKQLENADPRHSRQLALLIYRRLQPEDAKP